MSFVNRSVGVLICKTMFLKFRRLVAIMKKTLKYVLITITGLWIVFTSFVTYKYFSNSWENFQVIEKRKQWSNNPIWNNKLISIDTSFKNRIVSCNEKYILDFITLEKQLQNKDVKISAGSINADLINQFGKLYEKWPEGLRKFSEKYILNVFIVKNLGSSGYTFTADDSSFIIFIDESVLNERPNDFNRTENNCIQFEGTPFLINHVIEEDLNNLPVYTLENILIHEIGHCVGIVKGLTPTFDRRIPLPNELNFYKGCYEVNFIELKELNPYRDKFNKLKYYSNDKKMNCEEYLVVLDDLKNSPFPTTYSTQGQLEFFAEYFYSYIHCIIQKRPFEYRVFNNNKLIKSVRNGIINQSYEPRYLMIEKVINDYNCS